MPTTILHISDLHLPKNWHEEQGVVLREFFDDLKAQIKDMSEVFVAFTGDILQEGTDREAYQYFTNIFLLIHESPLTDALFLLVSKSDEVTTT